MRRPIALTDAELRELVFVSNVALDDEGMWLGGPSPKRAAEAHRRANAKLRAEARRRGWTF